MFPFCVSWPVQRILPWGRTIFVAVWGCWKLPLNEGIKSFKFLIISDIFLVFWSDYFVTKKIFWTEQNICLKQVQIDKTFSKFIQMQLSQMHTTVAIFSFFPSHLTHLQNASPFCDRRGEKRRRIPFNQPTAFVTGFYWAVPDGLLPLTDQKKDQKDRASDDYDHDAPLRLSSPNQARSRSSWRAVVFVSLSFVFCSFSLFFSVMKRVSSKTGKNSWSDYQIKGRGTTHYGIGQMSGVNEEHWKYPLEGFLFWDIESHFGNAVR